MKKGDGWQWVNHHVVQATLLYEALVQFDSGRHLWTGTAVCQDRGSTRVETPSLYRIQKLREFGSVVTMCMLLLTLKSIPWANAAIHQLRISKPTFLHPTNELVDLAVPRSRSHLLDEENAQPLRPDKARNVKSSWHIEIPCRILHVRRKRRGQSRNIRVVHLAWYHQIVLMSWIV